MSLELWQFPSVAVSQQWLLDGRRWPVCWSWAYYSTHQPGNVNSLNSCFERGKKIKQREGEEQRQVRARRGLVGKEWSFWACGPTQHLSAHSSCRINEQTQLTLAFDKVSSRFDTGAQSTTQSPQGELAMDISRSVTRTPHWASIMAVSSPCPQSRSVWQPEHPGPDFIMTRALVPNLVNLSSLQIKPIKNLPNLYIFKWESNLLLPLSLK